MSPISPDDTEALSVYFQKHVYDGSTSFAWIRWTDEIMNKNVFFGIFAALVALAVGLFKMWSWQVQHWIRYEKTNGEYRERF